jgi:hypothetical protein
MTLREFIEQASKPIGARFDQCGEIKPMYHFVRGDGAEVVMPAIPGPKDFSVQIARTVLDACEATRVLFISEGWILEGPVPAGADLNKIRDRQGSLEHEPGRVEVVMFSGEDAQEGSIMGFRDIVRESGKPPYLAPLRIVTTDRSEGRMIGLLPRGKLAS